MPRPYIPISPLAAKFSETQNALLAYRGSDIIGLQEKILDCARAHGIETHLPGAKQFLSNVALAACQHFCNDEKQPASGG